MKNLKLWVNLNTDACGFAALQGNEAKSQKYFQNFKSIAHFPAVWSRLNSFNYDAISLFSCLQKTCAFSTRAKDNFLKAHFWRPPHQLRSEKSTTLQKLAHNKQNFIWLEQSPQAESPQNVDMETR